MKRLLQPLLSDWRHQLRGFGKVKRLPHDLLVPTFMKFTHWRIVVVFRQAGADLFRTLLVPLLSLQGKIRGLYLH